MIFLLKLKFFYIFVIFFLNIFMLFYFYTYYFDNKNSYEKN